MIRLKDSRDDQYHDIAAETPMSIYCCGYTPREPVHLGNARPFYLADLLRRIALVDHPSVELVHDISDIDTRVEGAAAAAGLPLDLFVQRRTERFMEDTAAVGILPADKSPIASAQIHDIVALIRRLSDRDLTREDDKSVSISLGEVLQTRDLAHLDPDGVIRSMMCFTGRRWDYRQELLLWDKRATPAWDSPWGPGRPDENISCVALAHAYLPSPMTVHVGSVDVFSHHEIEMAVGSLDSGSDYAATWIHSGVVEVDGRRMANSVDNVRSLHDAASEYGATTVRMLYLATNYCETLDASPAALTDARIRANRLRDSLLRAPAGSGDGSPFRTGFLNALRNNLTTPAAVLKLEDALEQGLSRADADFAADLLGLALAN